MESREVAVLAAFSFFRQPCCTARSVYGAPPGAGVEYSSFPAVPGGPFQQLLACFFHRRVVRRPVDAMDTSLNDRILEVLQAQHLMALATQRLDGFPQTTWVNYVHDGFTLYFATDAGAQKAGNIQRNPKVSAAIATETQNFYKLRGISFAGVAHRISDHADASEIALRLFRRLPQSRRFVPEDERSLAVYRIDPVAISLIDYAQGFGRSFLIEL